MVDVAVPVIVDVVSDAINVVTNGIIGVGVLLRTRVANAVVVIHTADVTIRVL